MLIILLGFAAITVVVMVIEIELQTNSTFLYHGLTIKLAIALLAAIIFGLIIIHIVASRISGPIKELARQVEEIGKGNLDLVIDVKAKNEVGLLAQRFQKMKEELRAYIMRREKETVVHAQEDANKTAARKLMSSIRPTDFFDRTDFELYANTITIEDCGGDFYDAFFVDKTHLVFILGDVKGTGLVAAVTAALTCMSLRNFAKIGYSPARIMTETNNGLCSTEGLDMTVAAIVAVVDLKSGEMSFANAGMEIPLWKHAGDEFESLEGNGNFPLGSMENISYKQQELHMAQGDIFAMYSEGISQAKNSKGLEFSREYLIQSLADTVTRHMHSSDIVNDVVGEVRQFIGDIEPEDDGSIMMFRFFGRAR